MGGHRHDPAASPPDKRQEAGWAPGAGLDGCGKSRPHRLVTGYKQQYCRTSLESFSE